MKPFPTIFSWLKRRIPALDWLAHYERKHLPGDGLARVIVATLLIPQAMAYALLAGLPPQIGIVCSLLPLTAKRWQTVDSNQEFIALGAANRRSNRDRLYGCI